MTRVISFVALLSLTATPIAAQTSTSSQPTQTMLTTQTSTGEPDSSKKESAPPHAHTGWATLLKDTVQDFVALPKRKSTWTILGIGAAAALATHPADDDVTQHLAGSDTADDVFVLGKWVGSSGVQVGTAVGLWAVGRYVVAAASGESRTNKYSEIGFDLIRAHVVSQAVVRGMKSSIRRDRPTGECCSFPSGHSATAFAAASVLERHFGYRASWPALIGATYVAASRLIDNRHFLSDVMFGAAVGTASGWTVVGTRGRTRLAVQPVPVRGGVMIAMTRLDDPVP